MSVVVSMPRFFIHIRNGSGEQVDEAGRDFGDARLAVAEAAKMAGEILRDDVHDRLADTVVRVRIEDEGGRGIGDIEMSLSLATPT